MTSRSRIVSWSGIGPNHGPNPRWTWSDFGRDHGHHDSITNPWFWSKFASFLLVKCPFSAKMLLNHGFFSRLTVRTVWTVKITVHNEPFVTNRSTVIRALGDGWASRPDHGRSWWLKFPQRITKKGRFGNHADHWNRPPLTRLRGSNQC